MYAGQQVVAAHINTHGAEAKGWPGTALASVRRRHELLLGLIAQRVGGVPKDSYFPLGAKSRKLLNPGKAPFSGPAELGLPASFSFLLSAQPR